MAANSTEKARKGSPAAVATSACGCICQANNKHPAEKNVRKNGTQMMNAGCENNGHNGKQDQKSATGEARSTMKFGVSLHWGAAFGPGRTTPGRRSKRAATAINMTMYFFFLPP